LINSVRSVYVAVSMKAYAVDLATATRTSPAVRLGASPRASLQLVRVAKAWAAMEGRDYVIPDDLQRLLPHAFGHRMMLTAEAHMAGRGSADVLAGVLASVAIPSDGADRPTAGQPQAARPTARPLG
jgi:MoxR-like ATPase